MLLTTYTIVAKVLCLVSCGGPGVAVSGTIPVTLTIMFKFYTITVVKVVICFDYVSARASLNDFREVVHFGSV